MGLRRVFVAAAIADEARHRLAAAVRGLEFPGRRVRPEAWHVTLRFLGDVSEVDCERVAHGLDVADLGGGFTLRWETVGAFPRPSKASVLWLGPGAGRERLAALASQVEVAVTDAGLPGEDRPFRPHLTLSRVRPPRDVSGLVGPLETAVRMRVDEVLLVESHLGPSGARYESITSVALG